MTNFNWYFTRDEIDNKTPSREDGITLLTETRYRKDGARFIMNASNTLGLRYETTATGVVFFHRFYMMQSFHQFSRWWVVSAACLLLAGKVEETPKKCRDIIKVSQSLLTEQQMSHFGSSPKDELTTHERILLQTVKFDLQVQHPYSYLLKFAKQLKGEKAKIEKLVQMAWTFMNDSLCTTLCLQWEPQAIAIAFIYLAGKLSKFDLQTATGSRSRSWWRQYLSTLDVHDLESICHQVLDIYGEEEKAAKEVPVPLQMSQSSPHTPHTPHNSQAPLTRHPSQSKTIFLPPHTGGTSTPTTIPPHPSPSSSSHPHYLASSSFHQPPILSSSLPQQQMNATRSSLPLYQQQTVLPLQLPTTNLLPVSQGLPSNAPLAFSTLNVNVSNTNIALHSTSLQPTSSLQTHNLQPSSLQQPSLQSSSLHSSSLHSSSLQSSSLPPQLQPPSLQPPPPPPSLPGAVTSNFAFSPSLSQGTSSSNSSSPSLPTPGGGPLPPTHTHRNYPRGLSPNFLVTGLKNMSPLLTSTGGQQIVGVAGGVGPTGVLMSGRPGLDGSVVPTGGYPSSVGRGTPPLPLLSSAPPPPHPLPRAANIGSILPRPQQHGTGYVGGPGSKPLPAQSPIPGSIRPHSTPPSMSSYQHSGGAGGWTR